MKVNVTNEDVIENVKSTIKNESLSCRWGQCQCGDPRCEATVLYDNKDRKLGMVDYGYSLHVVKIIGDSYDVYVDDGDKRELEEILGLEQCPDGQPPWSDILTARRRREREDEVYAMGYGMDGDQFVDDLITRQNKISIQRYNIRDLRRRSSKWLKRAI